jgi:hypothetical protein
VGLISQCMKQSYMLQTTRWIRRHHASALKCRWSICVYLRFITYIRPIRTCLFLIPEESSVQSGCHRTVLDIKSLSCEQITLCSDTREPDQQVQIRQVSQLCIHVSPILKSCGRKGTAELSTVTLDVMTLGLLKAWAGPSDSKTI